MFTIDLDLNRVEVDVKRETLSLGENWRTQANIIFAHGGSLRLLLENLLAAVEGVAGEDIPAFLEAGRKAVGLDV